MTARIFTRGLALGLLLVSFAAGADDARPRVAIIIDDIGYRKADGMRALALPGRLTYAVLPGTPWGAQLAERAHATGREVILHLPLQSAADMATDEPGSLMLDMSKQELIDTFDASLASVPHAIGVNNHRGSLLSRHPGHMAWLMDAIRASAPLYFVDSRTTAATVALDVAREAGIPSIERDVFLDPVAAERSIDVEFGRLLAIAAKRGYAVAIGHPYPATLDYLEQALPGLERRGVELVSVGELIASQKQQDSLSCGETGSQVVATC